MSILFYLIGQAFVAVHARLIYSVSVSCPFFGVLVPEKVDLVRTFFISFPLGVIYPGFRVCTTRSLKEVLIDKVTLELFWYA